MIWNPTVVHVRHEAIGEFALWPEWSQIDILAYFPFVNCCASTVGLLANLKNLPEYGKLSFRTEDNSLGSRSIATGPDFPDRLIAVRTSSSFPQVRLLDK